MTLQAATLQLPRIAKLCNQLGNLCVGCTAGKAFGLIPSGEAVFWHFTNLPESLDAQSPLKVKVQQTSPHSLPHGNQFVYCLYDTMQACACSNQVCSGASLRVHAAASCMRPQILSSQSLCSLSQHLLLCCSTSNVASDNACVAPCFHCCYTLLWYAR